MKTEDLATEFLLTFLALLVQLSSWGPPAGPNLNGPSLNGPNLGGPSLSGPSGGSVSELGLSSSGATSSSSLATGLAYSAGLTVHRGALNPARALGPAFVANRSEMTHFGHPEIVVAIYLPSFCSPYISIHP